MNRWVVRAFVASSVACLLGWASPARATFILTLQSGASTISITDNGAGDLDSTPGSIIYSGSVGSFMTNITTGFSNRPGDPGGGFLQISTLDGRNTSAGQATLTATLEDTSFTQPSSATLQLDSAIGITDLRSTSGDSLSFQSYADPGNVQGGTAVTTGLQSFALPTTSTTTAFSDNASPVNFAGTGIYSMKNVTTITLSPNGEVNVSGTTTVVPEPVSFGALALAPV